MPSPSSAGHVVSRYPDRPGNEAVGARFEASFGYDRLGNRSSISYPKCISEPTT